MPDNDIALGPVGLPAFNNTIKKPPHLILISGSTKNSKEICFISTDRPDISGHFVQAKGFFVDKDKEEISKNFLQILTDQSKDSYEEIMFPPHRILHIKNLIFKAK